MVTLGSTSVAMLAVVAAPGIAFASCPTSTYYQTVQVGGSTFSPTGTAAGKRNAGTTTASLSVTVSKTTSRSSTLAYGATVSLEYMIAKVEGTFNKSVTRTTTIGYTVTDTVSGIPSQYYGYAQPAVEYRDYRTTKYYDTPQCTTTSQVQGTIHAIVADPFFLECVASSPCTPR